MSTLPEQFSAARKSQIEAQLNYFRTCTSKAFEGAEQLIALNFNTSRASLDKSAAAVKQVIAAKDPGELLALGSQSQANFDQLMAYGRALLNIASGVQTALIAAASAATTSEAPKPVAKLVPHALKPAPAPKVEAAPVPAPAPAPVVAAAPVAVAEPAPVVETATLPEPVVPVAKTVKKPAVAAEPAPAELPVVKAKPVAKAARKASGKAVATKPAASFPVAEKQIDLLAPKAPRKR
jgi:phasin family protein